jgi:hypothetical protein
MPTIKMTGMALQIGTGFKELIIKFQVQVMSLEIHDEKNRGHRAGEFAKSIQNIISSGLKAIFKANFGVGAIGSGSLAYEIMFIRRLYVRG